MKNIYMLGAGASKAAARAPIGAELVWDYGYEFVGLFRIANNGKADPKDLEEKNEEFKNYIEFLLMADRYFLELNEKERWDKAMSEEEMYVPPTHMLRTPHKKYFIDEILRLLKEKNDIKSIALVKRLILEHITISGRGASRDLYSQFIDCLPPNAVLMTTNFDTHLSDKKPSESAYFDYLINFDDVIENASKYYYKKGGIPVIKLNGSLDWGVCAGCGRWILFDPHVSTHTYDTAQCQCKARLEPHLVLPHGQHDAKLKKLWNVAANELKAADRVTVIGYSFPEYDQEIAELFSQNTNPDAFIEVVDCYDEEKHADITRDKYKNWIETRMKRIFKQSNLKVSVDGFEDYMRVLAAK